MAIPEMFWADETQTKIEELVWRHEEERDKGNPDFCDTRLRIIKWGGTLMVSL